jgi:hypothetical protein
VLSWAPVRASGAISRTVLLATVAILLILAARFPGSRAAALRPKDVEAHVTIPTVTAARVLSLGHNELFADLTWIRTLIYYGDGLVQSHGMPDVEKLVLLINRLDPWFHRVYLWGAHATTFRTKAGATQDEYRASIDILRRAVEIFPGDWELAWLLGVRLFFDLKPSTKAEETPQREEGAMYIERAMRLPGAPTDLPLLAASLRTRLGQKERALRELREMILTTEDEKARAVLEQRYALLADETASNELTAAVRKLETEWKANLPYVSPELYLLVGPPPPAAVDLESLARGEGFDTSQVEP